MLADLQNLPSRGFLPAEGHVAMCSGAPNYVAAHSTEPAQIVHTDPTNPLVRTLRLKKTAGKKRKGSPAGAPKKAAKGAAGGNGQKQARGKGSPSGAQANQASASVRSYSRLELGLMSLKGLQDVLRAHGAPVSGRKAELVERIAELQKKAAPQQGGGGAGSGAGSGAGEAGPSGTAGGRDDPVVLSDDDAEDI